MAVTKTKTPSNSKDYVPPKGFHTSAQAAEILGLPLRKFYALRSSGFAPNGQRIAGRLLFSGEELREWQPPCKAGSGDAAPATPPLSRQSNAEQPPVEKRAKVVRMNMPRVMQNFAGEIKASILANSCLPTKEFRMTKIAIRGFSFNELMELVEDMFSEMAKRKSWDKKAGQVVQFPHMGKRLVGCIHKPNNRSGSTKSFTVLAHTDSGPEFFKVYPENLAPAAAETVCHVHLSQNIA